MSWQPPPPNRSAWPPPGSGGPGRPGGSGPGGPGPGPKPQPPAQPVAAESQEQTLYDLLQVAPGAHTTIIRYSYRFLAGIYHPDNVETGNAEVFRQITEAFKTLSDSGRRAAYDAQMGPTLMRGAAPADKEAAPEKKGTGSLPKLEHTSVSYNEVELRLAILQLLLQARKKRVQTGGVSAKVLMDVLGVDMQEMEFALWYLREKQYAERMEAVFMITVGGVDYLVDQLSKTQIIEQGPKNTAIIENGPSLPATLK